LLWARGPILGFAHNAPIVSRSGAELQQIFQDYAATGFGIVTTLPAGKMTKFCTFLQYCRRLVRLAKGQKRLR